MTSLSSLRTAYKPKVPSALSSFSTLRFESVENPLYLREEIASLFPQLAKTTPLKLAQEGNAALKPLRVGVVFSGGQAPGGHNVIAGLYDALIDIHKESQLIGFLDGPTGIVNSQIILITKEVVDPYRNTGGFDLIGSGRAKIESEEDLKKAKETILSLNLSGLIIIGGDDSNTNAAILAEYFLVSNVPCNVVGIPKTIDGDLKGFGLETSFGFDTATKTYSATISSVARDILSAKKYYFFVRLMGRSASHITLECAMQVHPNKTLISEEIAAEKRSLKEIITSLADTVVKRAKKGKNYGIFLIPEGLVEFIPEVKRLIQELNSILAHPSSKEKAQDIPKLLSGDLRALYELLPVEIQKQLVLERDPHGNVQVSKIETERFFIELVTKELQQRKERGEYKESFSAVPLFLGYEGRSCLPSNFDANYCYNLGIVASLLTYSGKTGYMACLQNLTAPPSEWQPVALPIVEMLVLEERKGKIKPVIEKALVDLNGDFYQTFKEKSVFWELEDCYQYLAPIQFFGSEEVTDSITLTLEKV